MTRKLMYTLLIIAAGWLALTLIAERTGPAESNSFGTQEATQQAILTYSPDPIYNLDEQVCQAMAEALANEGWRADVVTAAAWPENVFDYDLIVFCANTYNWAPDWAVSALIKRTSLADMPVAALTLGSGSTARAQRLLEEKILAAEAHLLDSRSLWLMRPNDESQPDKSNVLLAREIATDWVNGVAQTIAKDQISGQ